MPVQLQGALRPKRLTAPPSSGQYEYSPTARCRCAACGKWFTPLKVWIDGPLIHSAGIRTCSWECSRKLYGIKVMPHTRVAQYNTRLLDKDEGGSG